MRCSHEVRAKKLVDDSIFWPSNSENATVTKKAQLPCSAHVLAYSAVEANKTFILKLMLA